MVIDIPDDILKRHKAACVAHAIANRPNYKLEATYDVDGGRVTLITKDAREILKTTPNMHVYNAMVIHDSTVESMAILQRKKEFRLMENRIRLNREELAKGHIYRCELSGNEVLVYNIEESQTANGKKTLVAHGKYYNPVTGTYDTDTFVDLQLSRPSDEIHLQSSMNT